MEEKESNSFLGRIKNKFKRAQPEVVHEPKVVLMDDEKEPDQNEAVFLKLAKSFLVVFRNFTELVMTYPKISLAIAAVFLAIHLITKAVLFVFLLAMLTIIVGWLVKETRDK